MKRIFLADANVLIDYLRAQPTILTLVANHLGSLVVPSVIVSEVKDSSGEDLRKLGVRLHEPTLKQLAESADTLGKLSRNDLLVFAMARDLAASCVTNDKLLRALCIRRGVEVCGGLRLMLDLCEKKRLDHAVARATVKAIAEQSRRISESVLEDFEMKLRRLGARRR